MSAPPTASGEPITDRRQLVRYMEEGCKPPARWLIGTEHEKFGFTTADLAALPYEGSAGIRALLEGLVQFGWQPLLENGKPIALTRGRCNITLEPGGQFELSGAPLASIHETAAEIANHLDEVKAVAGGFGAAFLGMGFAPTWRREDIHWMPKGRYRIMRDYMPKRGSMGLDMMLRTCTVQTNLDFASESDMVKKFRVSLALQPLATAMFANSPFVERGDSGFLSYRSQVWTDTDNDRCGMLPFVFESGMGFERYVDWLLDVPMYFVYRDGRYIDMSGKSFRDFMAGAYHNAVGDEPRITDWVDHITTAFPEVRLKRFLEMRGADCGPQPMLNALPALFVGLLYDDSALDAAWDLVRDWTAQDHAALRRDVPRLALKTSFRGRSLQALAGEVVAIATAGLRRRRRLDGDGNDESRYLQPLQEIVDSGLTLAERNLELWRGSWGGDLRPLFESGAY